MPDKLELAVAANADKLTEGGHELIITCASSLRFGCNWGFLKATDKDVLDRAERLIEQKVARFQTLKNGLLVMASVPYIVNAINTLLPNTLNLQEVHREFTERAQKQQEIISNMVERVLSGKKDTPTYIGLYSTNVTDRIVVKGNTFPAYIVTLAEFIQMVSPVPGAGARIFFDTEKGPTSINELSKNAAAFASAHKVMEVSAQETGVLARIGFKR